MVQQKQTHWEMVQDAGLEDIWDALKKQGEHMLAAAGKSYYETVKNNADNPEKIAEKFDDLMEKAQDAPEMQEKMLSMVAGIQQIARALRKNSRTMIARAQEEEAREQLLDVQSGKREDIDVQPLPDTFRYAFRKLAGNLKSSTTKDVSADEIAKGLEGIIENGLRMTFAMTTHPTSPLSTPFTKALIEYEQALDSNSENQAANRKVAAAKMVEEMLTQGPVNLVSGKKDPLDELSELMAIQESNIKAVPKVARKFKVALEEELGDTLSSSQMDSLMAAFDNKVADMIKADFWGPGDGDGNPNQNEKNLERSVNLLRDKIQKIYEERINELTSLTDDEVDKAALREIAEALNESQEGVLDRKSIQKEIKAMADKAYAELSELREDPHYNVSDHSDPLKKYAEDLEDLSVIVGTFGQHMAKIEVRHNAVDLMAVTAGVIERLAKEGAVKIPDDAELKDALEMLKSFNKKNFGKKIEAKLKEEGFAGDITEAAINERKQAYEDKLMTFIEAQNGGQGLFNDEAIIERVKSKAFLAELEKDNETGATKPDDRFRRILGRLQVMAKYPDQFNDLIIAEAETANHGKAALNLLKAAGSDLDNFTPENGVNVVPLFESRPDLKDALASMANLLQDETFRQNVENRGELPVMLAKSDTTRQHGPMCRWQQEETVAMLTLLGAATKDGEALMPENANVVIYSGGGDSLQRGGGKVTEIPYAQAKAMLQMFDNEGNLTDVYRERFEKEARKAGIDGELSTEKLDEIYKEAKQVSHRTTVQGHQTYTTNTGSDDAAYAMEGWLAQTLNSLLRFVGLAKADEVHDARKAEFEAMDTRPEGVDNYDDYRKHIYKKEEVSFNAGMDFYEDRFYNEDHAVHQSLSIWAEDGAPIEVVSLANTSSRPDKRPEGAVGETDPNVLMASQLAENATENVFKLRAIGLDKNAKHSGTYFSGTASYIEGMTAEGGIVPREGGFFDIKDTPLSKAEVDDIHEVYKNSKTFRDSIRDQANILAMKDFDHAWNMLGQERVARGGDDFKKLLDYYKENIYNNEEGLFAIGDDGKILRDKDGKRQLKEGLDREMVQKATLAFMEEQSYFLAQMVHAAATGKHTKQEVGLKDPLKDKWNEVYKAVTFRDRMSSGLKKMAAEVNKELKGQVQAYRSDSEDFEVDAKLVKKAKLIYAGLDVKNNAISNMQSQTRGDDMRGEERKSGHSGVFERFKEMLKGMFPDRQQMQAVG